MTGDEELCEAYGFLAAAPAMRVMVKALGLSLTREEFLARKDRFCLVTFDPTGEPTPPPLEVDLAWLWPVVGVGFLVGWLLRRRAAPISDRQ